MESLRTNHTQFSSLEMNVAVSIFAIGGLLGAVPAGMMADFLGRWVAEFTHTHTHTHTHSHTLTESTLCY